MAAGDTEKQASYAKILKVYYVGITIPFIVMGIGIVFGGVPTVFHFFRPQDRNPFVLAFFASIFVLWILSFYWIFFRGGAQILADHPGAVTQFENPLLIKLFVLIAIAGGVAGVFMMYRMNFPMDDFFDL